MAYTLVPITIKDSASVTQTMNAYNDGTQSNFSHSLLDNTGALIAPATSGLQTTGNTSLATIATNLPAQGQALAAASLPVVLTAAQITSLTAPVLGAGTNSIGTAIVSAATLPAIIAGSTVTRLANTTAYAFGQLISFSVTAATVNASPVAAAVAKANDQAFTLLRCRLEKTGTTVTNAIFRIHCYNVAPVCANGDTGAWSTALTGNVYLGSFDVTCNKAGTDGAWGCGVPTEGSIICGKPVTGTQNIYYLIEARAAYTPASGEVFTPRFEVQ